MTPADHDGTLELFDFEDRDPKNDTDPDIELTPPATVTEEQDYTMSNIHMGSSDPRIRHEEIQAGTVVQEELEIDHVQVLRVEVSGELIEIAQSGSGPVGIPVNLGNIADLDTRENEDGELQVIVRGVPEGVEVSEGERQEDGSVVVDAEDVGDLFFIIDPTVPVAPFAVFAEVVEVAEAVEIIEAVEADEVVSVIDDETDRVEDEDQVAVVLDTTASAPELDTELSSGREDAAISLNIDARLTDTDGSETLTLTIANVPEGATLSAGTDNGDGTWTLSGNELNGLTITPPSDYSGRFELTVTAVADETGGGSTSVNETLTVDVAGVADAATLSIEDSAGAEDGAIALSIDAQLTDTDGSESISIVISEVPEGATLSSGTNNEDGSWTLTSAQLQGLTITPPENYSGSFDLQVSGISSEVDGHSTTLNQTVTVDVAGVVDNVNLTTAAASGAEDAAIDLNIGANLTDTDGSEVLSVTVSGVPDGASLSAGTDVGDGSWQLRADQLNGLTVTPPADYSGQFDLSVTATSNETGGGSISESQTITVDVAGVADGADVIIADASGAEDTQISLSINAEARDASETLSISIAGVPEGASLSAGGDNGDGTWTLTENDLDGLTLTPAPNSHDDFQLQVTTTTTESNGDSSNQLETLDVSVSSVTDGPSLTVAFGDVVEITQVSDDASIPADNLAFHLSSNDVNGDATETTDGSTISRWEDLSGNNLDAVQNTGTPAFDAGGMNANGGIDFGSGDSLTIADDAAINTSTYTQKSFAFSFETGASVDGFQVIYEQGGGGRGYSLSIAPDEETGDPTLYAFVWNNAEWASGNQYQAIELGPVEPNTDYSSVMVHDSTDGDGTFTGFLNGEQVGQLTGVPMQYGHGGDIGIGAVKNDTVNPATEAGVTTEGAAQFEGSISEIVSWNTALSESDIAAVTQHMTSEWGTEGGLTENVAEVALNIDASFTDGDGSETLSITIADVPDDATLSAGTDNGDGTWTLTEAELDGLTMSLPVTAETPEITVTAHVEGDVIAPDTQVSINTPDLAASLPTLNAGDISGLEDQAIALDISSALTDLDGSESLSVVISGVPTGATLSAGTDNGDGSWTLGGQELEGLTVNPATNSDTDFQLSISATATEETTGETSSVSQTIDIGVSAQADAPSLSVSFGDVVRAAGEQPVSELPSEDLVFHFGAKDISGDGSGAADGDAVSRWEDTSGNNIDATAWRGTPSFEASGMNSNGGVDFGSSNSAVTMSDNSLTNTGTYDAKSFAFSFETGSSVDGLQVVYEQGGSANGYALAIAPDAETGDPTLYAYAWGRSYWASGEQDQVIDLGTVEANTSYSAAMVHDALDGDGTLSGYLNGELAGQVTGAGQMGSHSGDASFGAAREGTIRPDTLAVVSTDGDGQFEGIIGEAISWNLALSAEDIQAVTQHMSNEWGTEGGAELTGTVIELNIFSELSDTDGSESLSIVVDGIPDGAELSAGTDNGDGTWTLSSGDLDGLTVTIPNGAPDFDLSVSATASETSGETATTSVVVSAPDVAASIAEITTESATGSEDTAIDLSIDVDLSDLDGSETLSILISGVPSEATLSAGSDNGDGTWSLDQSDLDGLSVTPGANSSLDFELSVDVTTTETESGAVNVAHGTVDIDVSGVADQVSLNVSVGEPVEVTADLPSENTVFHFSANDLAGDGSTAVDGQSVSRWEDLSGNNLDATSVGSAPSFEADGMNSNGGVTFTSGNDALSVENDASINTGTYTAKSFAFSFETGDSIGGFQVVYEQGGTSNGYALAIAPDTETGEPTLFAYTWGRSYWEADSQDHVIELGPVEANTDYSAAMVHDSTDGDGSFTAYLNGDQIGQTTGAGEMGSHGGTVGIGSVSVNTIRPDTLEGVTSGGEFDGTISEVISWNSALSSDQVEDLTNHMSQTWGTSGGIDAGQIALDLDINAGLTDTDGSETISIVIEGLPDGASLSDGTDNGDGTWTVAADQIEGLQIILPSDAVTDFAMTVTATASEADGDSLSRGRLVLVDADGDGTFGATTDGTDGNDRMTGSDGSDVFAGGDGADRIYTGAGADYADGGDGRDDLRGGDGDDTLLGGADRDSLRGDSGTDILSGGADADALYGGDGDDILAGDEGNDSLRGDAGADELRGGDGNDRLYVDGDDTVIEGGDGIDRIDVQGDAGVTIGAGASIETAVGNVGDDNFDGSGLETTATFYGRDGDDALTGGTANDRLYGDDGGDQLSGGDGNDQLTGGAGADELRGGTGNDRLYVDGDDTVIEGGDGIDRIDVQGDAGVTIGAGASIETAVGNVGDDSFDGSDLETTATFYGRDGDDALSGGTANDRLYGDEGSDQLSGGDGNDQLIGGAGADELRGGTGNDRLYVDGDDTVIEGGDGIDRIDVQGEAGVTIGAGASIETAVGNVGDDSFDGSDLETAATFYGRDGDDVLSGGSANDRLYGDDGADELRGGAGNDRLYVDGDDTVIEGGDGIDRIDVQGEAGVTIGAGASIETAVGNVGDDTFDGSDLETAASFYGRDGDDVLSGGTANDRLYGDEGSDQLSGGDGNDQLTGGAGADELRGGAGNDRLYVDGDDTVIEGGEGIDRIDVQGTGGVTFGAEASIETAVGNVGDDSFDGSELASAATYYGRDGDDQLSGGKANDRLYGDDGADQLSGGDGNDQLTGGAGADELRGGAGNDRLYVDGDDTVIEGGEGIDRVDVVGSDGVNLDMTSASVEQAYGNVGDDTFDATGQSERVTAYGRDGDDELSGGENRDNLRGDAGADVLSGGGEADALYGGDGNDIISGDDGNDTLYGDAGADELRGGAGNDRLIVDSDDTVIEGGTGNDRVDVVGSGGVNLNMAAASVEQAYGNVGNDVFDASGQTERVTAYGREGDDTLSGGDNRDNLRGDAGADVISGGGEADALYGGDGNDVLSGDDGNDSLRGDAGADELRGGAGNDRLYVDADDTVVEGGTGTDRVDVVGAEGVELDMTASSVEQAFGGTGDDTFDASGSTDRITSYGRDGDDTITGGDDRDNLRGDAGNDVLSGGAEADSIYGGADDDTISGDAGNDYLRGDDGNDGVSGGDGDDRLYGGTGDDDLSGGLGNDRLYGEDGNDTLQGGAGNDLLDGGAGDDLFIFNAGNGTDTVHGGDGWLDAARIQDSDGGAVNVNDFGIELTSGSIEEQADGYVALSQDAAGTVTLNDGSELHFDGLERIEW